MKLCPRCETVVTIADAAYCTECGEELPEQWVTESRRPLGKYQPLHDWLMGQIKEYVTPTFAEISDILGFELPASASRYPAWWANQSPSVSQTRGWIETHLSNHGIDVDARMGEERWVIEVKGRGSRNEMRHNYFLNVLGQITQRMSDRDAKNSIDVPGLPQFRGLWGRYPSIAKQRLGISCLFVGAAGRVDESK